jgi:hypothetical protein
MRGPRFRFSLAAFLTASTLAGLLLGLLLKALLQPTATTTATSVHVEDAASTDPFTCDVFVNVVVVSAWRETRLAHAIVRLRPQPAARGVSRSPGIDFSNQPIIRHAPLETDISLRGTEIYVDGARWVPKSSPSILLFDSASRSFHEVPVGDEGRGAASVLDVTTLEEWQSKVVPMLREMCGASGQEIWSREP